MAKVIGNHAINFSLMVYLSPEMRQDQPVGLFQNLQNWKDLLARCFISLPKIKR